MKYRSYGKGRSFLKYCRRYVTVAAGAAVVMGATAHAQWTRVALSGLDSVRFYGLVMSSPESGLAVGFDGKGSKLYATKDGWASWTAMSVPGQYPFGIELPNSKAVLVGGRGTACKCATISRTFDAGTTWITDSLKPEGSKPLPGYSGIFAFSFADTKQGLAAGAGGVIARTTDGGATWKMTSTGTVTRLFTDISFPVPERGYVIATDENNPNVPNLFYRSTDGGQSWQEVKSLPDGAGFSDIYFVSATTGFVAGADSAAAIYKTTDGGTTWKKVYSGQDGISIDRLAFRNEKEGFASGLNGTMLHTTDGGRTWTAEQTGTDDRLAYVVVTGGTAYAIGQNGTLIKRALGKS